MFASSVIDTVAIGDVIVTIRKLSWKSLEKASDVKTDRDLAATSKMGQIAAQSIREVQQARAAATVELSPEEQVKRQREARYRNYDRDLIIRAGVKSWTAEPKLPAALEDLDEETAEVLYRAIVDLSLPALDPKVEEEARKNA
jgi:hypothetical protein